MTDEPVVDDASPPPPPTKDRLDPRRLRSFIGLTLARLGPQAFGDVSGTFLALLVGEQTKSLFATTFALTCHRLITWIAYPVAGRLSDRSHTSLGRRVPYMASGLFICGVGIAFLTHADTYWTLVGLLVLARLAFVVYNIPGSAVTPETFGTSRWIRAAIGVSIGGILVGLSIRGTVIATWDQNDPSTWRPTYYLAAAYMIAASFALIALVREAPAAQKLADRAKRDHHPLAAFKSVWSAPNAKVLVISILFAIASGGAVDRVYPLYARDVLNVGGKQLAYRGLVLGPAIAVGLPFAWWLGRRLGRKASGVMAGLAGAGTAFAHFWVTELWQSIALTSLSTIFLVAATLQMIPLYVRILPRHGGLAERIGVMFAPILIAGMVGAYASAVLYDLVVHEYWVLWFISGVFGLISGLIYLKLDLPPGSERHDPKKMFGKLIKLFKERAEGRPLFSGQIDTKEADGTELLETVMQELDPYKGTKFSAV